MKSPAGKHPAEEIAQVAEGKARAAVRPDVPSAAETAAGLPRHLRIEVRIEPGEAELIVPRALLRVREDRIGLVDGLERLLRPLVPRVQIRVQLASRGLPLAGDVKYGSAVRDCPIALWSHTLAFRHPDDGRELRFTAPPERAFPWDAFDYTNKEALPCDTSR